MKAPQKNETEPSYDPASRPPGINPKEVRTDLTRYLYIHVHSSVTHGSPAVRAAEMSVGGQVDEQHGGLLATLERRRWHVL